MTEAFHDTRKVQRRGEVLQGRVVVHLLLWQAFNGDDTRRTMTNGKVQNCIHDSMGTLGVRQLVFTFDHNQTCITMNSNNMRRIRSGDHALGRHTSAADHADQRQLELFDEVATAEDGGERNRREGLDDRRAANGDVAELTQTHSGVVLAVERYVHGMTETIRALLVALTVELGVLLLQGMLVVLVLVCGGCCLGRFFLLVRLVLLLGRW
mmetsp:Transcript_9040/g.27995  ORF Transcript_9040/g.27995 Transcript_9040/m.27995 type:complete len:210 (+) Transcript_9040:377-1006(+)